MCYLIKPIDSLLVVRRSDAAPEALICEQARLHLNTDCVEGVGQNVGEGHLETRLNKGHRRRIVSAAAVHVAHSRSEELFCHTEAELVCELARQHHDYASIQATQEPS